jgi:hypothetical protein
LAGSSSVAAVAFTVSSSNICTNQVGTGLQRCAQWTSIPRVAQRRRHGLRRTDCIPQNYPTEHHQ